jgi:uncharacterized membrane protein
MIKMTKTDFFAALGASLSGIPADEAKKVVDYYSEYFDEATEAGKTEEEIIASIDTPSAIATRVKSEAVFTQAEAKPSMSNWLKVMLVALGVAASPIALPIAVSIFAVIFAIFISVIAVIVSLGIAAIAIIVAGIGVFASGIAAFLSGNPLSGVAQCGAGLLIVGVAVFLAIGMVAAGRAMVLVTTKISKSIYNKVSKKGGQKQ